MNSDIRAARQLAVFSAFLALAGYARGAAADITVTVGGRLHVDAALYDEDTTELGSGTEFRRARLLVQGDLDEHWAYRAEYDFAESTADIKDAYLQYNGLPAGKLKIGQFKQAFSLEELTSDNYSTFMERGLPNVFVPSYRIGFGYDNYARPFGYAAGVFGDTVDDNDEDEGVGATARLVFAPELGGDRLLHLGLGATYTEPQTTDAGTDSFRIRQRPESHLTSQRLVDTGTLQAADSMQTYGLEGAWNMGPLSFQGEYMLSTVETDLGDFDFDGWYVYGSWFPGGQVRPYKDGAFARVEAQHAWEFALRYSSLDLDDGPVTGGEEHDITAGVNYYVNPHLRFMFNYVRADVEAGINGDEQPDIFEARAAFDF